MNKNPGQQALHDMMARQQQQQADHQRRGGALTWMKQEEERRKKEEAKQNQSGTGQTPADWQNEGYFQPDDQFSKVEAEVARLNTQLVAGKLSEADFSEQLNKLMVQDNSGSWWMVGAKTGGWYRYDGRNWVQSSPPGHYVQNARASFAAAPVQGDYTRPNRHPFKAMALFVILIIIVFLAGYFLAYFVNQVLDLQGYPVIFAGCIVWLVGLILALRRARRTWLGY